MLAILWILRTCLDFAYIFGLWRKPLYFSYNFQSKNLFRFSNGKLNENSNSICVSWTIYHQQMQLRDCIIVNIKSNSKLRLILLDNIDCTINHSSLQIAQVQLCSGKKVTVRSLNNVSCGQVIYRISQNTEINSYLGFWVLMKLESDMKSRWNCHNLSHYW